MIGSEARSTGRDRTLDVLGEHLLNGRSVRHERPNLDLLDKVPAGLPVGVLQRLGRLLDAVPRRLGRTHEGLPVGLVEELLERLGRDPPSSLVLATLSEHGNLAEHARDEERRLSELKVDVHVEGERPKLVGPLLLGRDLGELLRREALGEELLRSLRREDVEEDRSALGDETHPERGESQLDNSPVVEDLGALVRVLDRSLEVRHEEHVASLVVSAVEGVVVDVGEHSARANERVGRLVKVDAERVNERGGGGSGGGDRRLDRSGEGLLKVENDGVGLEGVEVRGFGQRPVRPCFALSLSSRTLE